MNAIKNIDVLIEAEFALQSSLGIYTTPAPDELYRPNEGNEGRGLVS